MVRYPKSCQTGGATWRVGGEEKFVELRRRYLGTREHGVRLPAMMDLVHEEMGEDGATVFRPPCRPGLTN